MAIGPQNQILLGCNGPSPSGHRNSIIINGNSGAVLAVLPDLGGADEVWFNESDGHYFVPNCNTACRAAPRPRLDRSYSGLSTARNSGWTRQLLLRTSLASTATRVPRRYTRSQQPIRTRTTESRSTCRSRQLAAGRRIFNPTLCSSAPIKSRYAIRCERLYRRLGSDEIMTPFQGCAGTGYG